jgi:hypothetical protein
MLQGKASTAAGLLLVVVLMLVEDGRADVHRTATIQNAITNDRDDFLPIAPTKPPWGQDGHTATREKRRYLSSGAGKRLRAAGYFVPTLSTTTSVAATPYSSTTDAGPAAATVKIDAVPRKGIDLHHTKLAPPSKNGDECVHGSSNTSLACNGEKGPHVQAPVSGTTGQRDVEEDIGELFMSSGADLDMCDQDQNGHQHNESGALQDVQLQNRHRREISLGPPRRRTYAHRKQPHGVQISASPEAWIYEDFLSELEVAHLLALIDNMKLRRHTNKQLRGELAVSGDVLLEGVARRVEDLALSHGAAGRGCSLGSARPMSTFELPVMVYEPGAKPVKKHIDEHVPFVTMLIYLSDPRSVSRETLLGSTTSSSSGGDTIFSRAGISVLPKVRRMLLWHNYDEAGKTDPFAEHIALNLLGGKRIEPVLRVKSSAFLGWCIPLICRPASVVRQYKAGA